MRFICAQKHEHPHRHVRKHDTASQESHSEDHRDKQGGSEVGITQYCIQHGEILLFDEADRIKEGFGQEKRVKYRRFSRGDLKKRSQNANVMYRKISLGDFQIETNEISVKKNIDRGSLKNRRRWYDKVAVTSGICVLTVNYL